MVSAKVIFIVIMLMPNDEYQTKSIVVPECPPIKVVGDAYDSLVKNSLIQGWNATCITINVENEIKEAT